MPAYHRLLLQWDSQPQEVVEVDWNNPIARDLVFLAPLRYGHLDDIVGGKRATVTGTLGFTATKDGVFPLFSGTQYIDYGAFGAEFPAGPATIAWIQTPVAQSGFSTLMNLMPNGGVNSWVCYQNGGGGAYAFTFGRRTSTGVAQYNTTVGTPVNGDTRRFIIRSPSLDTATYTDYSLFDGFSGALAPDGSSTYGGNTSTGMRIGQLLPSGGDGFDGAIGMVAIWKRQLSDAEARSYNANPWQIFAPRIIWVPVSSAAGTSYTITPSGGITLAGSGLDLRTKVIAPSGGVTFAGTGSMTFASGGTTYTITPSGGITMGGDGGFLKSKFFTPTGGVTMGGTSEMIKTKIVSPSGGVLFGGTGSMSSNTSTAVQTNERTKVGVGS